MSDITHLHRGRHTSEQVNHESPESTPSPSRATSRQRQISLSEPGSNLDEVAAPPPIFDRSEKSIRHGQYLENQHSPNTQLEGVPEQPLAVAKHDGKSKAERSRSKFLRTTYIVSYLILSSFVGTMLRMVIESLTFYPDTPVDTSVLWANISCSLIMGFLSEDKELFCPKEVDDEIEDHGERITRLVAHKKTAPLYIRMTTGFCGSLTSSTFIRDVFLALSNGLPVPFGPYSHAPLFATGPAGTSAPNGGFSSMASLAVLLTKISLSLAGLMLGAHIALFLTPWTPLLPKWWLQKVVDLLMVPLAGFS